jgi:hypothetical protein
METNSESKSQHPLAHIVLKAFQHQPLLDGSKLAPILAGQSLTAKEARYYSLVAAHTLEILRKVGLLTRNEHGWYHLLERDNVARLSSK